MCFYAEILIQCVAEAVFRTWIWVRNVSASLRVTENFRCHCFSIVQLFYHNQNVILTLFPGKTMMQHSKLVEKSSCPRQALDSQHFSNFGILEPAVHRMGAPTGCRDRIWSFGRRSYVDLVSFCARCPLRRASGQYTCRSVPQTSCAELARYTASPGVCDRTGSQVVQHSSIQSAQNRSKVYPQDSQKSYKVYSGCSSKMPRWGDNKTWDVANES